MDVQPSFADFDDEVTKLLIFLLKLAAGLNPPNEGNVRPKLCVQRGGGGGREGCVWKPR